MNARDRSLVCGIALAVLAYVLVRTAWLSDDAYITFRAVENFVSGIGLRWNPAERVQVFTHALWFFVLSPFRAATGEIYLTSLCLSMGVALAGAALLLWRLPSSLPMGVFAAAALLGSRAFVDYSTSGLENPLTNLLLVVFVVIWTAEPADARRRVRSLALTAALLMTNRLDTGLITLPALAAAAWPLRAKAIAPLAVGLLPIAAWEIFSVVYFGFPFPNTVYAKLPPNISAADLWPHGLMYLQDSLVQDPVTLPVMAAAIVAAALARRRDLPLAAGLVLSVVFTCRVGGDFMSGRFFAAPFVAAVAMLASYRVADGRRAAWVPALAVVAVAALCPFPPVMSTSTFDGRYEPPSGITDERRYYFQNSGLIRKTGFSRGIVTRREANVRRVIDRGQKVAVTISVGFDGYFAGQRLHIIDSAGLADPLMARLPSKMPWRIGHYLRETPRGYGDTLEKGANVIEDPGVAAFYDRISLVTRGPIWSGARWAAILELNAGRSRHLIDSYMLGYRGVRASAALGFRPEQVNEAATPFVSFDAGLTLFLDRPSRFTQVEFVLDTVQHYRIVYLAAGQERYAAVAAPPEGDGALVPCVQDVPESAGEIDEIRVVPAGNSPGKLAGWRVVR